MSNKGAVPDAWDDDWVNVADKPDTQTQPAQPVQLSKAERKAIKAQQNRELWQSAEDPGRNLWLEAQGAVPLKQEFKQPMTVLSRRPAPKIARRGGADGVANDDDEDSEEEARKKAESSLEERQRRAKIEREEKVRKYAEARERIMGSSTPGSQTPASRESSQGRSDNRRGPRGRGGGNRDSRPTSAGQSPARQTPIVAGNAQLFDPEDMSRRLPHRRETTTSPKDGEPLRQPRGPEGSGRGFASAGRGGRPGV